VITRRVEGTEVEETEVEETEIEETEVTEGTAKPYSEKRSNGVSGAQGA
jgi:hypothetical protein